VKLNSNVRNVLIIVAVTTVVYAIPSGNSALSFIVQVVSLGFLGSSAWIANRLYREHRVDLYSLGTRRRTILYVAAGIAALTLSATDRLWNSGLGTVVWLLLVAGCAYALYSVYRSMQEY
jgi:hypothetical protein